MDRISLRLMWDSLIWASGLILSTGIGLLWYVNGQKNPVEKEFTPKYENIIEATEQIANEYLDNYSLNNLESFQYRSIYNVIVKDADFDKASLVIAMIKPESISREEMKYVVSTKLIAKLRQCLSPLVENARNKNIFFVSAFALLAAKNHGTMLPDRVEKYDSEQKITSFESIVKSNGCLPYMIGLRGYARFVTSIEELDHMNEANFRKESQLQILSRELVKFKDAIEKIEHKFLIARIRDAEAAINEIEKFKSEMESWEKCFRAEHSDNKIEGLELCSNENHNLNINKVHSFANDVSLKIKSHSPGFNSAYYVVFGYFLSSAFGILFAALTMVIRNRRKPDDGQGSGGLEANQLAPPGIIGE